MHHDPQFTNLIALNAVLVWGIERLKRAPWFPWLQAQQAVALRVASAAAAMLGSAGISIAATEATHGGWNIVIAVPSLSALAMFAWHSVANYATQKGFYKLTYGNGGVTPSDVAQLIAKALEPGPNPQKQAGMMAGPPSGLGSLK